MQRGAQTVIKKPAEDGHRKNKEAGGNYRTSANHQLRPTVRTRLLPLASGCVPAHHTFRAAQVRPLPDKTLRRVLLLASGSGSNAQRLLDHFAHPHPVGRIVGLLSNKPDAYALTRARAAGVAADSFSRQEWLDGTVLRRIQEEFRPDLIVLAGFLWLVPPDFVTAYANRILNIHPSLLPRFGGRGMHGLHVHAAVLAAGETETGITIHWVNERYDDGAILFQARCPVLPHDTPETLAARVLQLEHRYLPLVVEAVLRGYTPAEFVRQAEARLPPLPAPAT